MKEARVLHNNPLIDLDIISKLPVTAKVLSKVNYKAHLDCHNYYNKGKTSKEAAIKERHYFFSFEIREGICTIYQTEAMHCEQEWIVKTGKDTLSACKKAIKEFFKRYDK